ncbi:hypothetical protein WICPIJ_004959 [Wickerhamomyces pijperi]|uniref:Uncharacterized protein n=1 Tax=Wickerhamomyces pijperi TaxID=599730 RepID=A0A9P8Q6M9_WICPI|nr:hypothetical protein WICPIJ_004959 [Wickerhamomyces pijperi]
MISCKLVPNSPTFCWRTTSPSLPSLTVTVAVSTFQFKNQPVLLVNSLGESLYFSLNMLIKSGISKVRRALLMEFLEKMLPKEPATTSFMSRAKIAVAACSLDEPVPKLKPEMIISPALIPSVLMLSASHKTNSPSMDLGKPSKTSTPVAAAVESVAEDSEDSCGFGMTLTSFKISLDLFTGEPSSSSGPPILPKTAEAATTSGEAK